MTKKQREERESKMGLLFILSNMLVDYGKVYFDGYENDKDRLEFTFDGHKCRLLEFNDVDWEKGTIMLTLLAKGIELKEWTDVRVNLDVTHFRYDTLRKIVVEVYMCGMACHNEEYADDVDGYIDSNLSAFFDSYC